MTSFAKLPTRVGGTVLAALVAGMMATTAHAEECTPQHKFETIVPGTLTVAVVSVNPIIELKDGKLEGFEGAILNEFARVECLKIDAQEIAGAGIIPAVQAKRVDLATGGWYRSKRRQEIVAMSYPTMVSKSALVSTSGDFPTYESAKGHLVGTPQGNLWVAESQAYYGDNMKIYQSFDQVFADLRAGRIEVALVPYELAERVAKDGSVPNAKVTVPEGIPEISTTMKVPQVGFPHVLDNPDFTAALDADIKQMHENGLIKKALEQVGIPSDLAETGEPYFID